MGEYRAELAAACRAITAYLRAKELPLETGVVRLDGLYGDAAILVQLGQTGLEFVLRGRNYRLLSHPDVQFRLRQPGHRELRPPESQVRYEVFEVGTMWVEEARATVPGCRLPACGSSRRGCHLHWEASGGVRLRTVFDLVVLTLSAPGGCPRVVSSPRRVRVGPGG